MGEQGPFVRWCSPSEHYVNFGRPLRRFKNKLNGPKGDCVMEQNEIYIAFNRDLGFGYPNRSLDATNESANRKTRPLSEVPSEKKNHVGSVSDLMLAYQFPQLA